MLLEHLTKAVITVDSFWTEGLAKFSVQSSPERKLTVAKALAVLIEEVEIRVRDLELTKRNADTTICNVDKIIKDRDHFQERATWLQGSLNESKNEEKLLAEERDKLKKDLQNAESDVAKFSKRYDHATHAQAVTAKALEEANNQRKGLVDKVAKFEDALDSLKVECSALKEANLKLEKGTEEMVKAGVENFRNQFEFTHDYENLQAFFVNFKPDRCFQS
ncbi:Uncharacterized protein Fot_24377 [Forsythia ovata]|uniref:Uncharacterized protein n=1 Tax=Forsythia ovata TaxID=205694 RepID=A0ABD1U609_9LAMI